MTGVAAAVEQEKNREEALKRLEEAKTAPPKQVDPPKPVEPEPTKSNNSNKIEAKHKQFDQMIFESKKKCIHPPNAKC